MNPIIANANGQARYNELLQDAEHHRLVKKVTRPFSISRLINRGNRLQNTSDQKLDRPVLTPNILAQILSKFP